MKLSNITLYVLQNKTSKIPKELCDDNKDTYNYDLIEAASFACENNLENQIIIGLLIKIESKYFAKDKGIELTKKLVKDSVLLEAVLKFKIFAAMMKMSDWENLVRFLISKQVDIYLLGYISLFNYEFAYVKAAIELLDNDNTNYYIRIINRYIEEDTRRDAFFDALSFGRKQICIYDAIVGKCENFLLNMKSTDIIVAYAYTIEKYPGVFNSLFEWFLKKDKETIRKNLYRTSFSGLLIMLKFSFHSAQSETKFLLNLALKHKDFDFDKIYPVISQTENLEYIEMICK